MPTSTDLNQDEFHKFILIADAVGKGYERYLQRWLGSRFAWILPLASRTKGAVGEKLVSGWLVAQGCQVSRSKYSDCDRIVDGLKIEIKFSTEWETGIFKFQQLRDQDYEFVFCLGMSPNAIYAWLIPKEVAWKYSSFQHGGKKGKDTKWFSFAVNTPPSWMADYGGGLEDVSRILRQRTARS